MTNFLRRFALTTIAFAMLAMPFSGAAYGGRMSFDPADTGGNFQTPLRIRGAYIFVTPLSQRQQRMQLRQERQLRRMLLMHKTSQREIL